ncbi:PadR family transcriptional regulator [Vibrio mediterranei]|nr:PadR family transcriptional regulator [Vibrio mediterranei]
MALKYILLTHLSTKAMNGATLVRTINALPYWQVNSQQVYTELKRMISHGWISMSTTEHSYQPTERQYIVEKEGREALSNWLGRKLAFPATRDELCSKLMASVSMDSSDVIHSHLLRGLHQTQQALNNILLYLENVAHDRHKTSSAKLQCKQLQARIQWLNECIDEASEREAVSAPEVL